MIKAYLAGIPSLYEGEDIEVRYCIYEDEELVAKESVMLEYSKPAVVGQVALLTLLRELEKYKEKAITVIVNDGALCEVVRGTSTTKNKDVRTMAKETNKALAGFETLHVEDISTNREERAKWNEVLHW